MMDLVKRRRPRLVLVVGCATAVIATTAALTTVGGGVVDQVLDPVTGGQAAPVADPGESIRLAFAGDVHFADQLSAVPGRSNSTLGPMSAELKAADVAMVNLESAVTDETRPARKELEDPDNRFWFRTGGNALGVLERSGVDVVSVANNHGADYGLDGVRDTLRAADDSPVAVIGAGRDDRQAFAPFRTRVKDTDIAIHTADAARREGGSAVWAATPGSGPGLASARNAQAPQLVSAVRESARVDDLVVVYLHWGEEGNACSTNPQEDLADTLVEAGADVIVGTHAHTPLGSGTKGSAYVNYGLGNFFWYHGRQAETGVLNLAVQGDRVVADEWAPAEIPRGGGAPRPLAGGDAADAEQQWRDLRGCTDLAAGPGPGSLPPAPADTLDALPAFTSSTQRIGTSVRRSMTSHDEGTCPVPLGDLRHLVVSHVDFDGRSREGELIVAADVADQVEQVFAELHDQRFPIERMRLVDDWAGDDDRSMAANNTSANNCRRVAGTDRWSDHAYGRAVDINPVQNPYVVGDDVRPPAAEDFVDADRLPDGEPAAGVISEGGVVRAAFSRIGWDWGGLFPDPDYQHFSTEPA